MAHTGAPALRAVVVEDALVRVALGYHCQLSVPFLGTDGKKGLMVYPCLNCAVGPTRNRKKLWEKVVTRQHVVPFFPECWYLHYFSGFIRNLPTM